MKTCPLAGFLLGLVCLVRAEAADAPDPQEIIKNSFSVMARTSFRAETFQNGIKAVIYHRTSPDGVVEVRTEYSMNQPIHGQMDTNWTSVILQNRDGMWKLRPGIALRQDYLTKTGAAIKASGTADKINESDYDYILSEGDRNGVPCYLIKATIQEAARSRVLADLENDEPLKKLVPVSRLMDAFPVEVDYCIGKTDSFMYSKLTFSKDGRKFTGIEYTNVVLGVVLADALFEVPDDYKVRILNTPEEAKNFDKVTGIDAPHFKKFANPASRKLFGVFLVFCLLMGVPILFFLNRPRQSS
jgi:hypothetical protein